MPTLCCVSCLSPQFSPSRLFLYVLGFLFSLFTSLPFPSRLFSHAQLFYICRSSLNDIPLLRQGKMALSKQQLYQKDRKWIWKFTLRIIAIVFAWVAGGCVVSMTHRLRISMFSGGNGYDQANMFILPSLLMTVSPLPFPSFVP